ncbi:ASKHA domain-containing protein [Clostridium formicaceticum]|uniref:Ferredoxin n=1 Tax=Clostridium formicaceticum TaxID=1497 RepID=A0AAC9WGK9_9CLOT|nr:ASKHA domain-containing protein [Clostridium formicaceticum]AOY77496.1 ferredoxin [Clostridium formicaceticum]ARE88063.1 Na(+)-translocating NADH-quinone reductase subunit F [Clostridium formicaceticum]
MPKIFIKNRNKAIEYMPDKDLLQLLLENEVFVDNPCNGKGSCGKCKIRFLEGKLPAISETEEKFLKQEEIHAGVRLSCLVIPQEDITIEILQKERKHEILTKGYLPEFHFHPAIHKEVFQIEKPTLEKQDSFEDALCAALGIQKLDWRLLQQHEITYGKVTGVFHGEDLIGIESGDTTDSLYGIAIDIGTTTVVAALIDIKTGEELAIASMINPQKQFGLDVLTRITYELENPKDAKEKLQHVIVKGINEMIEDLCSQSQIDRSSIYEIVIAANCTMMHFLLGIDATSIGKSPYAPVFVKSKNILARDIGVKAAQGARLYCLPSVSSYIGADIVAGAYVCQLHRAKENILFIDIGTNGEIVLSNHGKLLSCSCAAGPALEGMNIICGMRAAEGAIEDVKISKKGIELKVIGSEEPAGICGSGILAAVKELLRIGLVKKDGAFIKKEKLEESDYRYGMLQVDGKKRTFILKDGAEELFITQGDVRQVQLAKGAILSGFYALLNQANIAMQQLDKVMIAGQFGAHLPAESLVGTGILPEEVKEKIVYVGNSSKTGAYMALMSVEVRKEIEALANKMDYMELGASEGYERLFTRCLLFSS